jgi:hypothetical protein
VTYGDRQAGLGGEGREFGFPGAGAVAVGAARVGGDQQPGRLRVVEASLPVPPAADGFHREGGGVVVAADVDPAGVRRQVVDAIGQSLAQRVTGEVMNVDPHRPTDRPPFTSGVLELPDELLLFRVHADHRLIVSLVILHPVVDIAELRIPVRVLRAFEHLGVALQTETVLTQQGADRRSRYPMSGPGQLAGQRAGRLGGPAQRRHRIPAYVRLHQRQQRRDKLRIEIGEFSATSAHSAYPPQRRLTGVQFSNTARHRSLTHTSSPGHQPDPAMAQHPRLGPHQQPPLPLVQMREQHLELRRQRRLGFPNGIHAASLSHQPASPREPAC